MDEFQATLTYPGIALYTLSRPNPWEEAQVIYLQEGREDRLLNLSQYFGQLLVVRCQDQYHDLDGYIQRCEQYGDGMGPLPPGELESLWLGKLAPSWSAVPIIEALIPLMAKKHSFPIAGQSLIQACRQIVDQAGRYVGGIKFYLGNDWLKPWVNLYLLHKFPELRTRLLEVSTQLGIEDHYWDSEETSQLA